MGNLKYPFKRVVIIYNPKSTGDSEANARALRRRLRTKLPQEVAVELIATKRRGHAEEIGREAAVSNEAILLVSSSGDGGYNELINGVIAGGVKKATVVVLPSGNANDHDRATAEASIDQRIVAAKTTKIDVLKAEASVDGVSWRRYAHSYVGLGLTAYIGKKLTEANLNPVNEKWLTLKYLFLFRHVSLRTSATERWRRYSSVIAGNIDRMSKVITLGSFTAIDDGVFEIYETRERRGLLLLGELLRGATVGFKGVAHKRPYRVYVKQATALQCDGEVVMIDAGSELEISIEKTKLVVIA